MLADSAAAYYAYSGDHRVVDVVRGLLDYQIAHGTTPAGWKWARSPYASSDHGATEFMQPSPGRLITLESEHSLQTQGTGAVLLRGHPPHGAEPDRQRSPGALEDRSRRHGSLVATTAALQQHSPDRPFAVTTTPWAAETIRPSQPGQVRPACFLSAEVRLQLRQIPRVFLDHACILHMGATCVK